MASLDSSSNEDDQFLASCEEQFKYRYTENDEEFMKVFNSEPSEPPIIESWWVPGQSSGGRRNDRRFNRRGHPYSRGGQSGPSGYGGHGSGYGGQGGYGSQGGYGGQGGYGDHSSRDGRDVRDSRGRHEDREKPHDGGGSQYSNQFNRPKSYDRYYPPTND